ncbi:class I SAM-dependent methyltransferase [Aquisalimonas sp.]|uniref:class I SAM-dependent methyltransferase n=1 Tax=unclassified Aquisalimonas TaxID=2644645 RepID=UPI0025BDB166|nr:class I SAM-dependent methyltransferase [Aquisalimonas sp.]
MTANLRDKWDARYRTASPTDARAAQVLTDNLHLLPTKGRGLDLAAGLGGNAYVLGRHGITTEAWDLSPVGSRLIESYAHTTGLPVIARVRDVIAQPPETDTFDVIVVSAFLHRPLCDAIASALRPGGLLFYQTYCQTRVSTGGPSNPDFLLADGELLQLFPGLKPIVYREEGTLGDPFVGFRDRAMLVAERRSG